LLVASRDHILAIFFFALDEAGLRILVLTAAGEPM
jgi:hypothetical protein